MKNDNLILFSGPMVRAILEGRKTQTRRVMKPQPGEAPGIGPVWNGSDDKNEWIKNCTYGSPGDSLCVRETFAIRNSKGDGVYNYYYKADASKEDLNHIDEYGVKWKPSIHMPRVASRIQLKITGIRVDRLQNISEDDAKAEGIVFVDHGKNQWGQQIPGFAIKEDALKGWERCFSTARYAFANIWNLINEKRGYGWNLNPWVWVISFDRQ